MTYINLDLVTKLVAKGCTPQEIACYLVTREMMDEGVRPLTVRQVATHLGRTRDAGYKCLRRLEARGALDLPGAEEGHVPRGTMLRDTVFRV